MEVDLLAAAKHFLAEDMQSINELLYFAEFERDFGGFVRDEEHEKVRDEFFYFYRDDVKDSMRYPGATTEYEVIDYNDSLRAAAYAYDVDVDSDIYEELEQYARQIEQQIRLEMMTTTKV